MGTLMTEKGPKTRTEESEEKLIAKAKRGDIYSFERLVEKNQKKIYYLALRMTKSHDAADDLAQESFIKAYYSLSSFKEGYSFSAWVYRICMNLTEILHPGKPVGERLPGCFKGKREL
jgi:DNA-directed RNA polymerase specialized sigma subunit